MFTSRATLQLTITSYDDMVAGADLISATTKLRSNKESVLKLDEWIIGSRLSHVA